MLGEKDTASLLEILNVLAGRGRIRRGKGLYLAQAMAVKELKILLHAHGAENVKETARRQGWSLTDDHKPPEDWIWTPPVSSETVRRATKTKNPSEAVGNPPVTPEDVYRIHHEKLDVSRGQKCACAVCEEHRASLEETTEEKKEKSRWELLEID